MKGSVSKQLNCILEHSSRIFRETEKYLGPNKVTFTIPDMEQKFTKHAKKQKNVTHNSKKKNPKKLSIEKDSEIIQMAQLVGKDI